MTTAAGLNLLKDSTLFSGMSENDLAVLAPLFAEKEMAEGATVFVENMPGESLYLIREGTIRISKMLAEGDEEVLVFLGPEDVFGEMALFGGAARSVTARVAEKARLLSLRKDDFESLCEREPALALKLTRNIIQIFSRRIREVEGEYRKVLLWSLGRGE